MKYNKQFTINLDDNAAQLVERLAKYYQRKPAEMLRILITPMLINEYAKTQAKEHKENTQPIQPAIFKN